MKDQSNTPGKTLSVIAAAALALGAATYLVLPDVPEPALPVVLPKPHGEYLSWLYPIKNELPTIGFEIVETTNFVNWRAVGQAIGTNLWFVPSNRPASAFYTIGKAYALANTNISIRQNGF